MCRVVWYDNIFYKEFQNEGLEMESRFNLSASLLFSYNIVKAFDSAVPLWHWGGAWSVSQSHTQTYMQGTMWYIWHTRFCFREIAMADLEKHQDCENKSTPKADQLEMKWHKFKRVTNNKCKRTGNN